MAKKTKKIGKIFEAPKCPECKKELITVIEKVWEIYVFNVKTGKYTEEHMCGELIVRCPFCKTDISEIFEEGVCNYKAERKEK